MEVSSTLLTNQIVIKKRNGDDTKPKVRPERSTLSSRAVALIDSFNKRCHGAVTFPEHGNAPAGCSVKELGAVRGREEIRSTVGLELAFRPNETRGREEDGKTQTETDTERSRKRLQKAG